jgi:hypothetical protein
MSRRLSEAGRVRLAASLVVTLAATMPAFHSVVQGGISLPTASARFLFALPVCWLIVSLAAALIRRMLPTAVPDDDEPDQDNIRFATSHDG